MVLSPSLHFRSRLSEPYGTPTEAASNLSVWAIARSAARDKPLDDAETAMIAQIVAPHLAGMTPGSVYYRRHQLAS